MRALIVSNMRPSAEHPERGCFVRDQVTALRRIAGLEVELYEFAPGGWRSYARAAEQLRRARARSGGPFDIVHAHFGLSAYPALAVPARVRAVTLHGTDLVASRSRAATLALLRRQDLVATVSEALAALVPRWAVREPLATLPTGVDVDRFTPIPRAQARAQLGLDPAGPYLLFPADPRRGEKRHDRARQLAREVPLLTLGAVAPERVPLLINAANAVVVTSERESFGLAVLEALACEVPVLATPVGIAPRLLSGLRGTLCEAFDPERWSAVLAAHLAAADPRIQGGRQRALELSTAHCARRVADAWSAALERARRPGTRAFRTRPPSAAGRRVLPAGRSRRARA
jgi:teichuronic acid biosynthesis glycosyltransferase TuaC